MQYIRYSVGTGVAREQLVGWPIVQLRLVVPNAAPSAIFHVRLILTVGMARKEALDLRGGHGLTPLEEARPRLVSLHALLLA